ncbi:unnamed protein product [Cuscuta campestris]|uniref:Senescence regulator S40 n=1 Tax=Cuscuta campestris TaxID=132261 RepID=A0A484K611_9ASTE|nr:unnamed protein product [Cuscuta campestris]
MPSSLYRTMDQSGFGGGHRPGRSPSTDRFLGVFSPPKADSAIGGGCEAEASSGGGELNEDDVLWTGPDFTEPLRRSNSSNLNSPRQGFEKPEKFGILAALPEDLRKAGRSLIYQKHATASFARDLPSIPKPTADREQSHGYNRNYSQSMPAAKFQHSAPMKVPMMPKKATRNGGLCDVEVDDEDADDEMLPPHEIVARGSAMSPKTTFSVLEGAGRTLKGRDLRQVRNAVFRQTGFID